MLRLAPEHSHGIVLSSFLEHEINPLPLLRRCRERLREGGHVIVKGSNFECFHRKLRGKRWSGSRWPDHVNHFALHTLSTMAVRAGLRGARMSFLDARPFGDSPDAVLAKPHVPHAVPT